VLDESTGRKLVRRLGAEVVEEMTRSVVGQAVRETPTGTTVCESFHATLEKELLRSRSFKTRQEARTAIFDWIEAWYNPTRRHSRLGNPPISGTSP